MATFLPTTWLVFWPGCGDDFQTHDSELQARMAADFTARIWGLADVYENRWGRTRHITTVSRDEIRAAEREAA